jgi:hypothetical protein
LAVGYNGSGNFGHKAVTDPGLYRLSRTLASRLAIKAVENLSFKIGYKGCGEP